MTKIQIPEKTMQQLVQNACFAADEVAMASQQLTGAEQTRAIVKRALEALIGNGLILVVPIEAWPYFFVPYPPYTAP